MPVSINQFQAPPSTLDRIASALNIVKSIQGIRADSAALDKAKSDEERKTTVEGQQDTEFKNKQVKFGQEQDSIKRRMDPTSQESQIARADTQSFLGTLQNSDMGKKNPEAFSPLMKLASDPNTNAETLNSAFEKSPLIKHVTSMANKDQGIAALVAMAAGRNQLANERMGMNVNKDYTRTMAPYENTIQAANRAQEIISKIKSGDLKSTPTLRNDLNAAVGSMFNNGKGATVYSMSHSDQDSLYGRMKTGLGYVTGTAQDTLPLEQLDQLDKDIGSLKSSYADAHNVQYQSYREGLSPALQTALDNRFNKFRKEARVDGSPQTQGSGLPGMASSMASDAPQGTPQNPTPQYSTPPVSDIASQAAAEIARRKALIKK